MAGDRKLEGWRDRSKIVLPVENVANSSRERTLKSEIEMGRDWTRSRARSTLALYHHDIFTLQ